MSNTTSTMILLPATVADITSTPMPILSCTNANEPKNQYALMCNLDNSGDNCPKNNNIQVGTNTYASFIWVHDRQDVTEMLCRRYIACESVGPTDDTVCYEKDSSVECPGGWVKNDSSPYCYKK